MTVRNRALLDLAHDAPCFLKLGPCSGQVVPCHSDQLGDGRGVGHKSHDPLAVPGCVACHARFTRQYLGRSAYSEIHARALKEYIVWLWQNDKLKVA